MFRLRDGASDQGHLASPPLHSALARLAAGSLRGQRLEGIPVRTVYRLLPGHGGWVVAFDVPLAVLQRPVTATLLVLCGAGCRGLTRAVVLISLVAGDLAQRRAMADPLAGRSLQTDDESRALAVEEAEPGVWRWQVGADAFDGLLRCLSLLELPDGAPGAPSLAQAVRHCLTSAVGLEAELRVQRVPQETNVLKHASALTVSVLLEKQRGGMRPIVEDDGIGFDPAGSAGDRRQRLGLPGMRERLRLASGALDVESAPGGGTTLFVQVPLELPAPGSSA